jgi:hypothetical protein
MDTDDGDPANPSSLNEPRDSEQPQDLQPGQPETHEPELDAYRVPTRDRPVRGRAYLLAAGCLVFGGISAWLAVKNHLARLPGYLFAVGVLSALLTYGMAALLLVEDRRSGGQLKKQLRWMILVGVILAAVGGIGLLHWFNFNCLDACAG